MFFYLTNVVLDIGTGAIWWIVKNTTYTAYKGVKYLTYDRNEIEEIPSDAILMKEIKLLREELYGLKQL